MVFEQSIQYFWVKIEYFSFVYINIHVGRTSMVISHYKVLDLSCNYAFSVLSD